jgi:hypothetical protein
MLRKSQSVSPIGLFSTIATSTDADRFANTEDLATATQAKEASEAAVLSGETALQILDQLKSLPLIVEKLQALEPSIKDRTRAAGQSAEEASSSSSDCEFVSS